MMLEWFRKLILELELLGNKVNRQLWPQISRFCSLNHWNVYCYGMDAYLTNDLLYLLRSSFIVVLLYRLFKWYFHVCFTLCRYLSSILIFSSATLRSLHSGLCSPWFSTPISMYFHGFIVEKECSKISQPVPFFAVVKIALGLELLVLDLESIDSRLYYHGFKYNFLSRLNLLTCWNNWIHNVNYPWILNDLFRDISLAYFDDSLCSGKFTLLCGLPYVFEWFCAASIPIFRELYLYFADYWNFMDSIGFMEVSYAFIFRLLRKKFYPNDY